MQTKLIEILFSATGWMTSVQIADKGKWRSASHVGVELQLMEKAGRVVRRKSPTAKQSNGMPATEWRHVDKSFDGDHVPAATKMIKDEPVVKESSITEQPKVSNQVIRDFRTTEEENLRQQVAHLTDQLAAEKSNLQKAKADHSEACNTLADRDDDIRRLTQRAEVAERNRDDLKEKNADLTSDLANAKAELETAETAVVRWLDLAREYECKTIPELRVFIGALEERVESLRIAKSENVALKTLNGEMPGFGALHKALSEGPFVVRTPTKPPRFSKKPSSAQATAMSAARQHGFAEVFALVPVGKAVRGAEWVAK